MKTSAILSACGAYRYRLERSWNDDLPAVAFIMLNPSTADALQDDPTIRRCIGFAKSWGFGSLIVGNLFALRSTSPAALYYNPFPIGPDNNAHLREIAIRASLVVCAWGNHGLFQERGRYVAEMLNHGNLAALKVTGKGQPGHPLYVAAATQPKAYFA